MLKQNTRYMITQGQHWLEVRAKNLQHDKHTIQTNLSKLNANQETN